MNHSILVPGPRRCSNQPLPWRESACATWACACVIFGKWPTRIFVSPKEKPAAANHNKMANKSLDVVIQRLSILSMNQRNNQAPKGIQLTLSQRPGDEDAAIRAIAIQIFRKLLVDDDTAVVTGRGSVHEMQHAVTRAQCQADMRGRINAFSVAGNYSDDVAAAEVGFNFGDSTLWNFVWRSPGDV